MQVLLHADLRRIEDEYRFGPAHVDSAPVTLGRDLPDFFTSSGHPTGSLRDPCISRKQVSVRYLASPPRFEVSVPPDARRPVRFFTDAGAPLRRPSDIAVAELEKAQRDHGGDPARVSAALRISVRGLKQRLRELRLHAHDE